MNRSFEYVTRPWVGYYVLVSVLYGAVTLPIDLLRIFL